MRLTAAIGLVFVVSVACSSEPQQAGLASGTSDATTPPTGLTASPTPTRLPKLPLDEARLDGKYDVKLFVTSNNFASKPDGRQSFKFDPKCDEGACDVTLTGEMEFQGVGAVDRRQAGATGRFSVRLVQLRKGYAGTVSDFFGSCEGEPDKDDWTFDIKASSAKYVKDVWTVSRWDGTWSRDAAFGSVCPPAHLRAVIRGALEK